jgi:F0F1-type ATP synthase assembly protein I
VLERAAVVAGLTEGPRKVAKPEEDGLSDAARAQRGAAPYLDAVWRMVGALLVCAALGLVLDSKLGWSPWGVVVGLGLGLGVGFWSLLRSLSQLGKRP